MADPAVLLLYECIDEILTNLNEYMINDINPTQSNKYLIETYYDKNNTNIMFLHNSINNIFYICRGLIDKISHLKILTNDIIDVLLSYFINAAKLNNNDCRIAKIIY